MYGDRGLQWRRSLKLDYSVDFRVVYSIINASPFITITSNDLSHLRIVPSILQIKLRQNHNHDAQNNDDFAPPSGQRSFNSHSFLDHRSTTYSCTSSNSDQCETELPRERYVFSYFTLRVIEHSANEQALLDHYSNPRNVGSMPKNDMDVGTGLVGAPACGDVMKLQIRVDPNTNTISDVKFKTFGCGSAIASSSYLTQLVRGMSLEQAGRIKNTEIAKELCLPPVKCESKPQCRYRSYSGRERMLT